MRLKIEVRAGQWVDSGATRTAVEGDAITRAIDAGASERDKVALG